jgi:MoxR-like ATPase
MTTPATVPAALLDRWRSRLEARRAVPARVAELQQREVTRHAAQGEVSDLLDRYLRDEVALPELRNEFDKKTRNEWSSIGASGPNGAMVLNQIAAQATAFPTIERAWRGLLRLPADAASADAAIEHMCKALDAARAVSETPLKIPQNGRIPVLASVLWSARKEDDWPPYFGSVVKALVRDRLYDGEGYAAFRDAFLDLRGRLGATSLELEELAAEDAEASTTADAGAQATADRRVWLIAPGKNAVYWESWLTEGVMTIGWRETGDLTGYPSVEAIRDRLREVRGKSPDPTNAARACWQFAHDIKPGDIVFAKRGIGAIVGRGEVTSEYRHQTKGGDSHVRSVRWDAKGEWHTSSSLAMKTLTEIGKSPQLVKELADLIGGPSVETTPEDEGGAALNETYTLENATAELFMAGEKLEEILEIWRYKQNLILQGPPGVGKTFVASRLAHLLIGSTNEEQICRVQFHPSYAYEDFVQGLRPTASGGFERHDGPLLRFCKQALQDQESVHVLIIDEINRGNVSKILGELLSLLEADKRTPQYGMTLAYARPDEPRFHVPPNLFVIGMMNTADRALSLVDYALRRRFVFVDITPAFERPELHEWWIKLGVDGALRARIQTRLRELNDALTRDPALGPGYAVGHSYFVQKAAAYDDAWFDRVLRYEIEPLLREYWFDSPAKVQNALLALRS